MAPIKFARLCLYAPLFLPAAVPALTVDIQGVRLEPVMAGASCVDIAGDYHGVRIEPDQPGQKARVCYNAARLNSLTIANATLIATAPVKQTVSIRFQHEFPPGINGKIVARAKLQGFFTTKNGVGIPVGDKLSLKAFFSQGGTDDGIADPFELIVGEELDSALFNYSVKEPYLVAGPRTLKGELKVVFTDIGHKVTFPGKCVISLDTGGTFEDKLETLEVLEEDAPPVEGAPPAGPESPLPAGPEGAVMPGMPSPLAPPPAASSPEPR